MRFQSCSLLDLPAGCMARVEALNADPATRSRLYALGFIPGTEIQVFAGCGDPGSRRVKIKDACLVLDENMAGHISCIIPGGRFGCQHRRSDGPALGCHGLDVPAACSASRDK